MKKLSSLKYGQLFLLAEKTFFVYSFPVLIGEKKQILCGSENGFIYINANTLVSPIYDGTAN